MIKTNIQQAMIIHTGGAGGFARLAGQAAVEVGSGDFTDVCPLEHFLDQVNTATWTVQFVAIDLVGWTGGRTKTAVHTSAQNTVGLAPFICRQQLCR